MAVQIVGVAWYGYTVGTWASVLNSFDRRETEQRRCVGVPVRLRICFGLVPPNRYNSPRACCPPNWYRLPRARAPLSLSSPAFWVLVGPWVMVGEALASRGASVGFVPPNRQYSPHACSPSSHSPSPRRCLLTVTKKRPPVTDFRTTSSTLKPTDSSYGYSRHPSRGIRKKKDLPFVYESPTGRGILKPGKNYVVFLKCRFSNSSRHLTILVCFSF